MRYLLGLIAVVAAGCASFDGRHLVPGQSSVQEVVGAPADKRIAANGDVVYYYPRLPWGYATYAARIGPHGVLVALEQRLTIENAAQLRPGVTRAEDVLDLLGPPFEPLRALEREIWTYPMRVPGYPTPRWFLVQLSSDGLLRETYFIDDPHWIQPDSPRRR
jgi:hypothetical protein